MATMIVTLDGDPIACRPGSRTGFDGEDSGEVALECRLAVEATPRTKPVLEVALSWSHAHYMSAELLAD